MLRPQIAINLEKRVVDLRGVADELFGPKQAPDAAPERRRLQPFLLVNQAARQLAMAVPELLQPLQHLPIGVAFRSR